MGAESAVFVMGAALGVRTVQSLRLVVPRGVIIHVNGARWALQGPSPGERGKLK